jgi:outer membrane protein assembly factor BamB
LGFSWRRSVLVLLPLLVISCLMLAGPVSAKGLQDSPWPQYRCDHRHTGLSQYSSGYGHVFYGESVWSVNLGDRVRSSPAISKSGTIYVGCDDGNLYAVEPNSDIIWSFETEGAVVSSPALDRDGTIYVGSSDNNLYAVLPNGKLKWSCDLGSDVITSPSIGPDGTIFVGSMDGVWYALDTEGTVRWSLETEGYFTHASVPVGDDGTVYMVEEDGHWLYAMDKDGNQLRTTLIPGIIRGCPAVAHDGTVYVAAFGGSDFSMVYAVSPEGEIEWTFNTTGFVNHAPAVDDAGMVYFGSSDGVFYALNADGTVSWTHEDVPSFSLSSPAIDSDGIVFIGLKDGDMATILESSVHFDITTGDEIWSSPAIGSEGRVYFGSNDGNLYALEIYEAEPRSETMDSGNLSFFSLIGLVALIIVLSAVASIFGLYYRGYGGWRTDGQVPPHAYEGRPSRMYPGEEDAFHPPESGRTLKERPPP